MCSAGGGRRVSGGWPLVALLGAALLVGGAPLYDALPHWWAALEREFGWPRRQLALPWSITGYIAPGLAVYLATGWLSDRVGPRPVVVAGLLILAGAWAFFGLAQNLGMYYGAFAFLMVGAAFGGWVPVTAILGRRFARRRATAIAAASMVAPVGAVGVEPIIAWGVNLDDGGMGWRLTAIAVGGCALLVGAAVFARRRGRLGDAGLPADGDAPAGQSGRSTAQALRTRAFWFIVAGSALAAYSAMGFSTIIRWLGPENNFTPSELGNILSIESPVSIAFYLVGGLAGDRVAKHKAMAVFALLPAAGLAAAVFIGGLPGLYLCSILLGMGTGGLYPLYAAILADYFWMDSFGKILGLSIVLSELPVSFAGAWVIAIYHTLGSYPVTLLLLSALALLGAFLFLKAHPPRPASNLPLRFVTPR